MKYAAQMFLVVAGLAGLVIVQGTDWGRAHPWLWLFLGVYVIIFYCLYQVLSAAKAHKFKATKARVPGPVKKLVEEFEAAGFQAGDGFATTVIGGATVIPLVNKEEKTVAAIYMLDGGGVIWEIFCYGQVGSRQVTVSTSNSGLFGRILRPPTDMIQILRGITPTEGVERHWKAKDYAVDKGVNLTPVTLLDFGRDCDRLYLRRSQWIKDNILAVTFKTVLRSVKSTSPDEIPIPSRLAPW